MMKVKVTLLSAEPEMRRMSIGDDSDFADFRKKVSELFNEIDSDLLFQWKDDEDDMIMISSDEEFQEALKSVSDGLLRIFIKRINDCPDGVIGESGDNPDSDVRMDNKNEGDVRPRRWRRRLNDGNCRGRGWGGLDMSPSRQRDRHHRTCSERREWRRMRQALKLSEGLDMSPSRQRDRSERREWRQMRRALKLSEGQDKPERGCHGFHRKFMRKHEHRCGWMNSADEMDRNRWAERAAGCQKARRCNRLLGRATGGCRRSRLRNVEDRGRNRCRRASSAPPARSYDETHATCRKGLRGKPRRCRSASMPPFSAGRCRRQRLGHLKRNILIKLKIKNAQNLRFGSDNESGVCKERCLRRRCKSYRWRAMRKAEKEVEETADDIVTPGEGMEPRMEALSLDDDGGDALGLQNDQKDDTERRQRKCKRSNHGYQDEDGEENGIQERRRGKCRPKYRKEYAGNEDVNTSPENISEEEMGDQKCFKPENGTCRRQTREYRRALREARGLGRRACRNQNSGERGCHRSVTVRVGMDGHIKPRKLARKLFKILNQEVDTEGNTPERNSDQEEWSRKDHDRSYERPRCKMFRRRQTRGPRRFRTREEEFSRQGVDEFRPRGWYRRNFPW